MESRVLQVGSIESPAETEPQDVAFRFLQHVAADFASRTGPVDGGVWAPHALVALDPDGRTYVHVRLAIFGPVSGSELVRASEESARAWAKKLDAVASYFTMPKGEDSMAGDGPATIVVEVRRSMAAYVARALPDGFSVHRVEEPHLVKDFRSHQVLPIPN